MKEIMQIRRVFKKHLKKPRKIYSKMRYNEEHGDVR